MYIPREYRQEDREKSIEFIRRFHFGILVTCKDSRPIATHIPFVVHVQAGELTLSSHISRANEMGALLDGSEVLCIFSAPHGYVSPSHYDKTESVPTWNYLAVHAYGKVKTLDSESDKLGLMKEMISSFEPEYLSQWDTLPAEYKQRMLKGTVGFRIHVHELQNQEKLSQDKSEAERERIAGTMGSSNAGHERLVAEFMKKGEEA